MPTSLPPVDVSTPHSAPSEFSRPRTAAPNLAAWLASGLFLTFASFMILFNRAFAYLNVKVKSMPVFATEPFLICLALSVLSSPRLRQELWKGKERRFFSGAVGFLLVLTGVKIVFSFLWRVSSTPPMDILRQAALGYYAAFALFALALWPLERFRDLLVKIGIGATLGACAIAFIFQTKPHLLPWGWIQNFHHLPVYMWAGVFSIFLLAYGKVDPKISLRWTTLFIVQAGLALLFGGRSIWLGLMLGWVAIATLRTPRLNYREILVVVFTVLLAVGGIMLQRRGVLRFQNPEDQEDAWSSWGDLAQVLFTTRGSMQSIDHFTLISRPPQTAALPPTPKPVTVSQTASHPPQTAALPPKEPRHGPGWTGTPVALLDQKRIRTAQSAPKPLVMQFLSETRQTDLVQPPILYNPAKQSLSLRSAILNENFSSTSVFNVKVNNSLWRLELWHLMIRALFTNPVGMFGFPFGTKISYWAFSHNQYSDKVDMHNSHLAFLVREGVVGFCLYTYIILLSLSQLWKRYKRSNDPVSLGLIASIGFIACLASFNVMLEGPFCGPAFWSILGIALAHSSQPPASA